jgi:hypothetical protein
VTSPLPSNDRRRRLAVVFVCLGISTGSLPVSLFMAFYALYAIVTRGSLSPVDTWSEIIAFIIVPPIVLLPLAMIVVRLFEWGESFRDTRARQASRSLAQLAREHRVGAN